MRLMEEQAGDDEGGRQQCREQNIETAVAQDLEA